MKNIIYNTTRQWNCGDEFILFGVRNILNSAVGRHNGIIYNRNPDIRPMNGKTAGLRNEKLKYINENSVRNALYRVGFNENSIHFDTDLSYVDFAVFAGTPENLSPRCYNLYEHIYRNNLPALFIGIGDRLGADGNFYTEALENAFVKTVRDEELLEMPAYKKLGFQYLPCPALLSAPLGYEKEIKEVKTIGLVIGTNPRGTVIANNISEEAFNFMAQAYRRLIDSFDKKIKFKIICHHIDDINTARKLFGGTGAEILYSYDSKDYFDIYKEADFVVSTRVHGCGIAASLGIPSISLGHDGRAGTTKGFLAAQFDYTRENAQEEFINFCKKSIADIEAQNQNLLIHKKKIFDEYARVIKSALQDRPRPVYSTRLKYAPVRCFDYIRGAVRNTKLIPKPLGIMICWFIPRPEKRRRFMDKYVM